MSQQLFNNHKGRRGATDVQLTFAELYAIMRERMNYAPGDYDPDALCQRICCEIEKKMNIYPNVEGLK